MMPVSRVAAAVLLSAAVPAGAHAATTARETTPHTTAKPAATNDSGDSTSSDGLYALFPASPEQEKSAGEFYGSYDAPGGVKSLRAGLFVGNALKPAAGDPGTASATAAATNGQASERAGVGTGGGWLPLALAFSVTLLLAVGLLSAPLAATARAALPRDFVGITAEDVFAGSDSYQTSNLQRQRAVGFTTIRQVFRWSEIEPTPTAYDFTATDRFVLNAARAGIRVFPLLFGEPTWASSRPVGNTDRVTFPPINNNYFARFASVVAARYGPGGSLWRANPTVVATPILAYQLWNEPNLPMYWGRAVNPAAYANMVRTATPAIRKVQPKAVIVSGGIPDSKLGMKPASFLKRFMKARGGTAIDALGVHPYALKVATVLKLTQKMRRTLDRYKGKKIKLWVTELGWAAGGPFTQGRTVSNARQASAIASAYKSLAKHRRALKLNGIFYFAWRDLPPYPGRTDFWGLRTGLITLAGTDKPALPALTRTIKLLTKPVVTKKKTK
jgi:GH35 family endo-1,4-beta-xylanase